MPGGSSSATWNDLETLAVLGRMVEQVTAVVAVPDRA